MSREFTPTGLRSARYAVLDVFDQYSRNWIFVREARKARRVLECGCSNGFLSRLITDDGGPVVVGLELEADAAEEARQYCDRVVVADLASVGWAEQIGETFDLITFGDVLEHLPDPVTVLRRAATLLEPGGSILVSLPNIAHWSVRCRLLAGRFDYRPTGIMDATHLRFFTRRSAVAMLQQAGFVPVSFTPTFGGRFTTRCRPLWSWVTHHLPGLFAHQMIFRAVPGSGPEPTQPDLTRGRAPRG